MLVCCSPALSGSEGAVLVRAVLGGVLTVGLCVILWLKVACCVYSLRVACCVYTWHATITAELHANSLQHDALDC